MKKIIFVITAAMLSTGAMAAPKKPEIAKVGTEKSVFFKNCTAAFKAGYHDMKKGEPGYAPKLDRDKDGIACETDNAWVEYRDDGKYHRVDEDE